MKNRSMLLTTVLAGMAMIVSATSAIAQNRPGVTSSYSSNTSNKYGVTWYNVEASGANEERKEITMYRNGDVYKVTMIDDKITAMWIGEKKLTEVDFAQYEPMMKDMMQQLKVERERAEKERIIADQHRAEAEKMREKAALDREHAEHARELATRQREKAELDREQAAHARALAASQREKAELDRAQAEQTLKETKIEREKDIERLQQADKVRLDASQQRQLAEQAKLQAEKARLQADQARQEAGKARAQAEVSRQQAEKERAKAEVARKQAEQQRKLLEEMIDELVKEQVIASKEELKVLQLTDESLIINDKKQPAELHQRLKNKYLKKAGTRITYQNGGQSRYWNIEP